MDAHVILNPTAGPLTTRADLQRALDLLSERGWRLTVQESTGPGDITRLARQAAANQVETLIVAGGDGTLSEAANGLAGSSTCEDYLASSDTAEKAFIIQNTEYFCGQRPNVTLENLAAARG